MQGKRGRLYRRGRVWWGQWQTDGKRFQQSTGETNRRDAEAKLRRMMEPFALREQVEQLDAIRSRIDTVGTQIAKLEDERNPPLLISKAWERYLDAPNRPATGHATMAQYAVQFSRFRRWLEAARPDAQLMRDVTPETAGVFRAHLGKTISPNTTNKYLNLLALIWRVLSKEIRSDVNPWTEDHVTRLKIPNGTGRNELTIEQVRKLVESAQGDLRTLLLIGLYCGLRLGDAARLTWEEVDFVNGFIVTIPHKTESRGGSALSIPLADTLRRHLLVVPEKARRGFIMPKIADDYEHRSRALNAAIQSHFSSNGIATTEKAPGRARVIVRYGFHSLRHSFITHATMAGWPEALVRAIVGHASRAVTKRYTHVNAHHLRGVVTALPDVLTPATTRAVAALPSVMSDALTRPVLGEEKTLLTKIRHMLEGQQAKNWRDVRASVLGMIVAAEAEAR